MKSLSSIFILLLLFHRVTLSQDVADSINVIKFSERIPAELILVAKVKLTGAIGYADCFSGKVLKVSKGILSDTTILITVLAYDSYLNLLKKAKETDEYKIYLVFNKAGEKYSTTYVTGFVDSDRNSWKIIGLEKLK